MDGLTSIVSELFSYSIAVLFLFSGYLYRGWRVTLLFFVGSLYWTMLLENFGAIMHFFSYNVQTYPTAYPVYLIWIGLVPFWISIGWFDVIFPAFQFSSLFAKDRTLTKAVLVSLIAVNLDLLIDPAATASGLWAWTHESFYFLGVPITNYIGWFLLPFLFTIVFDITVIRRQSIGILKPLERFIWKNNQNLASFKTLVGTFFLRLVIFQLVFMVIYSPILMTISSLATSMR